MPISKDDIRWVAHLARLRLSEAEIDSLGPQMARIIEYVEQLQALSTDGVEPLTHPNETTNRFRDDELAPSLSIEAALANAPQRASDFFAVPKVLD